MGLQQFKATVADKIQLGSHNYWLDIELSTPHTLQFEAGQYLLLTVPGSEQKKSYSIASPPSLEHKIELLVDSRPSGPGSAYVSSLEPGDEIQFHAPVGMFTLSKPEQAQVFIATGSGITPLRSMILDLLQDKQSEQAVELFWGLRAAEHVYWEEDWRMLDASFPQFTYFLCLSQPPENWPFPPGRVSDYIRSARLLSQAQYYLCGSTSMVHELESILQEKGVQSQDIHKEKFF